MMAWQSVCLTQAHKYTSPCLRGIHFDHDREHQIQDNLQKMIKQY